jgi:predicted HAD superfamily Cof-like phosphohydrolase|tara:strand:- start:137 stop:526 length:390 start_codon:yes stop_codon:yes gene_type:complete
MFKQVRDLHLQFGINHERIPFTQEEKDFRTLAMIEEVNEYMNAETKHDELDALIDVVVFALGTAERQGMLDVFKEAYLRVMEANSKKEIGQNAKRNNFKIDLVKPEGWKAADLEDLVSDSKQIEMDFGE